jgi:hypothetical protein
MTLASRIDDGHYSNRHFCSAAEAKTKKKENVMKIIALAAGIVALTATAFAAGPLAPCPDDYQARAVDYVSSRLDDPRGSSYQFVGEPYAVSADFRSGDRLGWGVDVRIKSRMSGGGYGAYVPYTVIFVDGEPAAFAEDGVEITRI